MKTLSDKIVKHCTKVDECLWKGDVKEFIKDLKDIIIKDIRFSFPTQAYFIEVIDKLAGNKLVSSNLKPKSVQNASEDKNEN